MVSGTKEWSTDSVNVCCGCSHDCLYCYAKAQMCRFGRKTPDSWATEELNQKKIKRRYPKYDGTVMIPTTHDITPGTIEAVSSVVYKLLAAGNQVLIVSKPRPDIIETLCHNMQSWEHNSRSNVLFRFTIGSYLDETLKFWEPGAPCFADRLASLAWCHEHGWKTSVSCEPMLENIDRMIELVAMLEPAVTDAVWLGKMNQIRGRLTTNGCDLSSNPELAIRVADIERWQTIGQMGVLYERLKGNPKVKWKESIKRDVGIPLATEAGTDE